MLFPGRESLESVLKRLELVDPATLEDCERSLAGGFSSDELIDALSRRNALTGYQVGRLKKGETEGLRLGPYKLLYRNASGSFARVYRAASASDGRVIGIKLLRQRWASDPRVVALFRREGELGKRLKHKNIVPIYDVVSDGKQHYFTMEFVEGGNFRDFLRIRGKFSPAEATKYVCDMAEGLQYALAQGLTHRDLKLTNVLLSSQGVAKLVDFGLAGNELSQFEEEVDRAVEYAALERGSHAPENDPRSDLYFLGAIYYELLTGQPPYPPTRDRQERKQFNRYRNIRPLRSIDPNVPSVIEDYVRRLMHINPNDRYQTPGVLLSDLRAVLPELRGAEKAVKPPTAAESEARVAADDTDTALLGSDTSNEDSSRFEPVAAKPSAPTVLCVENRPKHQDAIRDYFTRHGFRVLLLTDPQRALNRLSSSPPDALVLIGDVVGNQLPTLIRTALGQARKCGTVVVALLGKKVIAGMERLPDDPLTCVLPKPVTLRDIRYAIRDMRERNSSPG
jgi:serine/threonine protein kinase